uniref:Uncharacterized protein n=1 Tax=Candidatus Kentrum sp. FM TaxID=2126340 RepID=A0A450VXJ8_9GAMM|nr:MAG: hypothetical protein BECKFM1743A_GA0114220_101031 [Candidatus Kentron sp. FM]VFK09543.1 MAG: hypothetical protein BECKFM1743B_GA0114221_101081 [Candidatus Kentron sp. FM]
MSNAALKINGPKPGSLNGWRGFSIREYGRVNMGKLKERREKQKKEALVGFRVDRRNAYIARWSRNFWA